MFTQARLVGVVSSLANSTVARSLAVLELNTAKDLPLLSQDWAISIVEDDISASTTGRTSVIIFLQQTRPPSTVNKDPVWKLASSLNKYATNFATSSGRPARPTAVLFKISSSTAVPKFIAAVMGVAIKPLNFVSQPRNNTYIRTAKIRRCRALTAQLHSLLFLLRPFLSLLSS